MGLKDFNFKQVFVEKGERIGLGFAAVIALLLVLTLFWPGSGFLSGSAGANADVLNKAAEGVENGLRTNKPEQPGELPDDPTNKLVAFNFTIIDPAAAKDYSVARLFDPIKGGRAGRQMPELYLPRESQVALVRFQLPALVFDSKFEYLATLKNAPTGGAGAPPGMGTATAGSASATFTGPKSSGYNPMTAFSGTGASALTRNQVFKDRTAATAKEEEKDFTIEWKKIADLTKDLNNVKLAEQPYPLRAAEIVATFPYKDQVREFRDKLRLQSDAAVLSEPSLEVKGGRVQNAFRFLGVNVERRQVDAPGKPVGDKEGWAPLDLEGTYKPLVILDGKRFEDEDPKLRAVMFPGLVMKKLVTLGARHTPPLDEYPKVEDQLPSLTATLDALNKKPDAVIPRPALTEPGSIFADDASLNQLTGPNSFGPGPAGSTPPAGSSDPIGSTPMTGMPYGPDSLKPGQELAVPDACLIRLFDVTVEPGKTYEYRMRVRMANPNYHRTDAASQGYADDTDLPTKSWYVLPQKVTDPQDLYYYAVDQKELDVKEPKDKELKLPQPQPKDNQTVIQIHRWVDYLRGKNRIDLPVGDWVIAERAVVTRGEPIGPQRVEAPYWRTTQDKFVMASDLPSPKPSGPAPKFPPSVEVPFAPDGDAPIVVDFTGGALTYQRTHPKTDDATAPADPPLKIEDKAPLQVLIMTPDGKLLAHDGAKDATDPVRVKRLQDVRDWIQNVKNNKNGGADSANPFGGK